MKPDLTPPRIENQSDSVNRSARERMEAASDRFLLRVIDLGGLSILVFFLFQYLWTPELLAGYAIPVLAVGCFLPARVAAATGRKRLARWWFSVAATVAILALPALANGLRTPLFAVVPMALLMVSWLLGRRPMLVFAAVYAIGFVAYWWCEANGIFVAPREPRSIGVWLMVFLEILSLTAVALWALVKNYESVHAAEASLHTQLSNEVARSSEAFAQLAQIYDGLSSHICVLDEEGVIVSVNKSWRDFYARNGGSPQIRHEGQNYLDVCTSAIRNASPGAQDVASFYVLLQDVLSGKAAHFELEYPCDSPNEKRWFIVRVTRTPGLSPVRIVVAHDDISLAKQAQEQLRGSLAFTRNLIESMQEGFSVLDCDGWAFDANPALCRMTGFERSELVGIQAPFPYWPPEEYDRIRAAFESTLKGQGGEFELTFMRKNGERFPANVTASSVRDEHGQIVNYVATVSDATERKRAQEQIHRLAFYDALTSLPNRRLLHDRLNQTLTACKRSGRFAALMVLDLDNFKALNDSQGHAAGDLLLIEAAQRLRACVREMDTVARFGGDEFVVLIRELNADRATSAEQVKAVAEKVRHALSQPYLLQLPAQGSVEHHCTASIGVALFNQASLDVDEVMRAADQTMYQAKHEGRDRVCVHGATPD